ncbi:MAG: hypothetical protein FD189_471 [Elusimicrobia bacterium]|nr:MAG: hypothetical protein FD154_494 [Elusimicrobiota bacterium]KAF0157696.1 MAG: hypothetical protein FD189_471 [Elusimicrobiota bacterium]
MKKILLPAAAVAAVLITAAFAADLNIPDEPGAFNIPRPEARGVIADLGIRLKLSAKQEERISGAIQKQTREFDSIFKEYERAAAEEKKWRYQMNEHRYKLSLISKGIPDLVREYLDVEQREAFDTLLDERRKPVAEVKKDAAPAQEKPAELKPAPKKKVLVRRKKAPAKARPAPAAPVAPEPADEAPMQDEEYDDLGSYP